MNRPHSRARPPRSHRIPMNAREAARTRMACTACRERKIKYSGEQPCRYCTRRNLEYVVPENSKRKLYSMAYVQELERRALSQEHAQGRQENRRGSPVVSCQAVEEGSASRAAEANTLLHGDNTEMNTAGGPVSREHFPIETGLVMSSSLAFSSYIKAISVAPSMESRDTGRSSKTSENAYELPLPRGGRVSASSIKDWPTEEQARALVRSIADSISQIQHLFDPRSFSDRLSTIYDRRNTMVWENGASTAEILMVFTVGKLL
ncbi:Zn(II)2Cys6 transcription factor domain-containing protein [Aspergillus puulaauensis]|uniref:Zn(2)-C6 fungal-type domain-containing protein n=1 Tax=Aspergillus puulaauensis TaxID=1220207 RepID=A0A7R7XPG7_9EURO|nr:uncharacterized protein APUU_50022A [Aspergillus puulaauensis]BCS25311.1 hypothetical protein APUU_50022A [Aspergillus puulaauensis]